MKKKPGRGEKKASKRKAAEHGCGRIRGEKKRGGRGDREKQQGGNRNPANKKNDIRERQEETPRETQA